MDVTIVPLDVAAGKCQCLAPSRASLGHDQQLGIRSWRGSCTAATDGFIDDDGFDDRPQVGPVPEPQDVLYDPLLHERGALMRLAHPQLGDLHTVGMGLPIRFSRTPSQFDVPTPELGSANDQVYRDLLKLDAAELARLRADGVI